MDFILVVPDIIDGVVQGALRAKVINQKPKTRCRQFAACVFLREVSSKC
jgi:hypothetical protein